MSEVHTRKNPGKILIKKSVCLTGFLFLLFFAAFVSYMAGYWRFNYPPLDKYPVQGLDISHHQGDIDWLDVPKDKIQFVYIKATEGGDYKDRKFTENWNSARLNGFSVGAYHFFTLCRVGAEQASNFVAYVPLEKDALPPVVDLEFVGNCKKRPSREFFLNELRDYTTAIEEHYATKPVLYTTYQFHREYLKGTEFESYPFWIRDVFKVPDQKIFPIWAVWQYADNARIPGIKGPVDLNVSSQNIK